MANHTEQMTERACELAGIGTLAVIGIAAVIICTPFMVLGWAAYRLGLWQ